MMDYVRETQMGIFCFDQGLNLLNRGGCVVLTTLSSHLSLAL